MKIIFLGYKNNKIIDFLIDEKNSVLQTDQKITLEEINLFKPDLIISYGYKYIIKKHVLEKYKNKIINLHISYLPWNRGSYPNIWSIIEKTPKGVTIHLIDEGIDTGKILFQKKVKIEKNDTLYSSYFKLRNEIEKMFMENWLAIKTLNFVPIEQNKSKGTFHFKKTSEEFFSKIGIMNNWDIKVDDLIKIIENKEIEQPRE